MIEPSGRHARRGHPRCPRARRGEHTRRRDERGFTLVELIISIMVLTVGVLGLASTSAVVMRMITGGGRQTVAATVAQSRFEQLAGGQCSTAANGADTTRNVTEKWVVASAGRNQLWVVDSVSFQTMSSRPATTRAYTSFVRCH